MADGAPKSAAVKQKFGEGFLGDVWYFAALASDLRPGRLQRYEILGEPVHPFMRLVYAKNSQKDIYVGEGQVLDGVLIRLEKN